MKKILYYLLLFVFLCFSMQVLAQKSQGIGTNTPNPRAVIELNVEDAVNYPQGLLLPRISTVQRNILSTVAGLPAGMSVFDNTDNKFYIWNGSIWTAAGGGSASQWTTSGANIFYSGGNVSVGTNTVTSSRLSIQSLGNSSVTSALNIVNSAGASILYMRDDGMMGINTTAPGYHLQVNGRIKSNGLNETSDLRLKKDIEKLTSVLDKVLKLQGVSYRMRNGEKDSKKKELGLIAQEVEVLFPDLVQTDEKGYKSLEYSRVVALLIEAIKEQNLVIQYSKIDIQNLKSDMEGLKTEWKVLQQELIRSYSIKSEK